MKDITIGQVLSLRIRYNNNGLIAGKKHPYLVVGIDDSMGTIEIAQLDSLQGKEYKAAMRSNKTIWSDNPTETVIDKDSYVQLDNTIKVEYFDDLSNYRRQTDTLSAQKLNNVISAYRKYHNDHEIDELKNVYMDEAEIRALNT